MRRANQQDPTTNGQLRMVGDHLGSTTLVLDTSAGTSGPQVIHRQYYKPYGEVATQSGSSRTSIGYTGQRLDSDSGLMFYNARFYDPVLSYFVSADSIAPDKADLKTRNRYSYVSNNPIRYNDPSGYCKEEAQHDAGGCAAARDTLRRYGFDVNLDEWSLQELDWIIAALNDLLATLRRKYGYNLQDFKNLAGIRGDQLVRIINVDTTKDQAWRDKYADACFKLKACTDAESGRFIGISPFALRDYWGDNGLTSYYEWFKYMVVHEVGHVMDYRNNRKYSKGLDNYEITGHKHLFIPEHEDPVSDYGKESPEEDWAETVATEVYSLPQTNIHGSHRPAPRHRAFASSTFFCSRNPNACAGAQPPMTIGPSPICRNINGCR